MACKGCGNEYIDVNERGLCYLCEMDRKERIVHRITLSLAAIPVLAILGLIFIAIFFTWDYHTGQDTGYISAVDKMTLSDDRAIYLRRRPLDSFMTTEEDEHVYCTTADRTEVIEKAYEAMSTGKRVIVVYDEARPFGWRKWGHCNQAPITDIKVVEEQQ